MPALAFRTRSGILLRRDETVLQMFQSGGKEDVGGEVGWVKWDDEGGLGKITICLL